jgi:hypothetical protein
MATRRKVQTTIEPKEWRTTAGGNVKSLFRITPEQDKALRDEAFKRAAASGSRKPDASEVLREVLEDWLKRRKRGTT